MAADRGAYICQSQSLNLFVDSPSTSKLTSMHFYAWKKGLKTGMYYLRSQAASQAVQFTVEKQGSKEVESLISPTLNHTPQMPINAEMFCENLCHPRGIKRLLWRQAVAFHGVIVVSLTCTFQHGEEAGKKKIIKGFIRISLMYKLNELPPLLNELDSYQINCLFKLLTEPEYLPYFFKTPFLQKFIKASVERQAI